jgi:hypothetical protein
LPDKVWQDAGVFVDNAACAVGLMTVAPDGTVGLMTCNGDLHRFVAGFAT